MRAFSLPEAAGALLRRARFGRAVFRRPRLRRPWRMLLLLALAPTLWARSPAAPGISWTLPGLAGGSANGSAPWNIVLLLTLLTMIPVGVQPNGIVVKAFRVSAATTK